MSQCKEKNESQERRFSEVERKQVSEALQVILARLNQNGNKKKATDYLVNERGLPSDAVSSLDIHYSDFSNQDIRQMLSNKGFSLKAIHDLGFLDRDGKWFFGNSIIIPIWLNGEIVNLYSRALDDRDSKHLFLKGLEKGIFNFDSAKTEETVFITEAIIDCSTLLAHGYKGAVAVCGSKLSDEQLKLLQSLKEKKIYICFDNDADQESNPGMTAAIALGRLLPAALIVELADGKHKKEKIDVNSYFQGHNKADFDQLLKSAKRAAHFEPYLSKMDNGELVYRINNLDFVIKSYSAEHGGYNATVEQYTGKRLYHKDKVKMWQKSSREAFAKHCCGDWYYVSDYILKLEKELEAFDAKGGMVGNSNNVVVGDLKEITPGQDFQDGKAYVTVPIRQLQDNKLVTIQHLISSDRKKIELNASNLLAMKYYSQRSPSPSDRWSDKNREAYLNGDFKPDIAGCYTQIKDLFLYYIAFEDIRWYEIIACWIIGTHFHRIFSSYPYVHLNGVFRTGKTKTMTLASCFGFNGELTFQSSPSYVIRTIHDNHSTCCIDEAEKLNTSHDHDSQVVVSMFNAGYKKGAFCGKAEQAGNGEKWMPKKFEAYSPKMFASIEGFAPSLASRCIPVAMIRTGNKDILNREVNVQDPVFQEVRDKLYPIMLTCHTDIEEAYKEIHDDEILGREWELWKPILAIAKVIDKHAGEESKLYDRMRGFALEVLEAKKGVMEDDNLAPIMLRVLADYLKENKSEDDFYSVVDLVSVFKASSDENFNYLKDERKCTKPGRWVGNELRKLGVIKGRASQRKRERDNKKGYTVKLENVEKLLHNSEL